MPLLGALGAIHRNIGDNVKVSAGYFLISQINSQINAIPTTVCDGICSASCGIDVCHELVRLLEQWRDHTSNPIAVPIRR